MPNYSQEAQNKHILIVLRLYYVEDTAGQVILSKMAVVICVS